VLISGVRRGSPADEADMRRGYILVKIDDHEVVDLEDFKERYKALIEDPDKDHLLYLKFLNRNWFSLIEGRKL
jgi:C-terminal processing protease CtpA/Prc